MTRLSELERQRLQQLLAIQLVEVAEDHEQTCNVDTADSDLCSQDIVSRYIAALGALMRS